MQILFLYSILFLCLCKMIKNYLYLAQNITDKKALKHHIYKVGCSKSPDKRVATLSGSASTDTYRLVYKILLPMLVKDNHVLTHKTLQNTRLYKNSVNQKKYLNIYGHKHMDGLQRRRELVMFGEHSSEQKVKTIFRCIVLKMTKNKEYTCRDTDCVPTSNNGEVCAVCKKYTQSLWNYISYHKTHMDPTSLLSIHKTNKQLLNILELERKFTNRVRGIKPTTTERVEVGDFWLVKEKPNAYLRLAHVKAINETNGSVKVQWWFPLRTHRTSLTGILSSIFAQNTRDGELYCNLDSVSLHHNTWQCSIRMKKGPRKGQRLIFKHDQRKLNIILQSNKQYHKIASRKKIQNTHSARSR